MHISPDFSLLGLAVAVPLTVYLAAIAPLTGKRSYDRLARTRDTDPKALTRTYASWIGSTWLSAAVAGAAVLASPGVSAADLGLTLPSDPARAAMLLVAILAVTLATAVAVHRQARSGRPVPGSEGYSAMLPRTRAERGMALGMSITAGVAEEILYRGLLIALGVHAGLGLYASAALAVALFGLGHLYQGWRGVLGTTYAGAAMTFLYLSTGSLLVPILAHTLMDVRGLVLTPAPRRPLPSAASSAAA
jgi:membrane protease YdiL (CAAX protease family)